METFSQGCGGDMIAVCIASRAISRPARTTRTGRLAFGWDCGACAATSEASAPDTPSGEPSFPEFAPSAERSRFRILTRAVRLQPSGHPRGLFFCGKRIWQLGSTRLRRIKRLDDEDLLTRESSLQTDSAISRPACFFGSRFLSRSPRRCRCQPPPCRWASELGRTRRNPSRVFGSSAGQPSSGTWDRPVRNPNRTSPRPASRARRPRKCRSPH